MLKSLWKVMQNIMFYTRLSTYKQDYKIKGIYGEE